VGAILLNIGEILIGPISSGGGADINNWQLIEGGSLLVWLIKQGGVMILLSIHYR
jgi:hypothetical protein